MKKKSDGTVYDDEYGKPITIHSNCWIASNVVITGKGIYGVSFTGSGHIKAAGCLIEGTAESVMQRLQTAVERSLAES